MRRPDVKREHPGIGADPWEGRLSEYLDGDLPARERQQLDAHLRVCGRCTALLEELRAVMAHAAACPRESEPARDLWEGISPRLRPRQPRSRPGPNLVGRARRYWGRDWIPGRWRVPALAAAAVIVLAAVASLMWRQGGGELRPRVTRETGQTVANRPAPTPAEAARLLEPSREYYDTIAHLRRTVELRLTHDPRVVEVLDTNLAIIDAAIAGYRDALAADPRDADLARRLEQARERKVEILRQAAELAGEATN